MPFYLLGRGPNVDRESFPTETRSKFGDARHIVRCIVSSTIPCFAEENTNSSTMLVPFLGDVDLFLARGV